MIKKIERRIILNKITWVALRWSEIKRERNKAEHREGREGGERKCEAELIAILGEQDTWLTVIKLATYCTVYNLIQSNLFVDINMMYCDALHSTVLQRNTIQCI